MAPSAIHINQSETTIPSISEKIKDFNSPSKNTTYLLERNIHKSPPAVVSSTGNYIYLDNGQQIFDATCGAAVSCLGHGNKEVQRAIIDQMTKNSYVASLFFSTPIVDELALEIIKGTKDKMSRAFFIGSGKLVTGHYFLALLATNRHQVPRLWKPL